MTEGRWIYDIEVYPNLFLLGAKQPGKDDYVFFQVSPYVDDRPRLANWLLHGVTDMVGYNNLSYDSPVLHNVVHKCMNLRGRDAVANIKKYSDKLVKSNRYPPKVTPIRPQIDLFKINHFDNKAKMTSLKLLEFNLRVKELKSLPYTPDTVLTKEQIWEVVEYNKNDLIATEKVYNETLAEINLREKMSPAYGIDFTNFNSTKMGEYILIEKIVQAMGKETLYNRVTDTHGEEKWVIKNTEREFIDFSEVVFDYVEFKTPAFKALREWFVSQVITETKGVFSKIPVDDLKLIEGHYATEESYWHDKSRTFKTRSTINRDNELKTLNVVYKGFRFDFGVGGIHGCIRPGVYKADDRHIIRDIDVASYYPNLAIENGFFPAHIGPEFCKIYKGIYVERQGYPKSTHKAENLTLKLALNGSYGKSNSKYSALCDPQYTMLTTINGQLLLCMLAEDIMEEVPEAVLLQINTDGLTVKAPKEFNHIIDDICDRWQKLTKLELEDAYYSQMIIKDVNNYIGVFDNGGVKRKGAAFIYKQQPGELEMHKNFSQLVVPQALEAYFVNDMPPEDFMKEHDDVYDFFKRTKIPKTSSLEIRIYDEDENIINVESGQNITRYLVTGKYLKNKETKKFEKYGQGETFIKIMPPTKDKPDKLREFNVEAGWLCTEVNTLPDDLETLRHLIDYDYYVEQAYNVIEMLEYKHDDE